MDSMKITLPLPPSVNRAYDMKIDFVGGRTIPRRFLSYEAVKFKEYSAKKIQREMKKLGVTDLTSNGTKFVKMSMTIFMNKKHRDSDNLLKLTQDTITKSGLIADDSNLLVDMKNLYIDHKNPRMELEFEVMDKLGIFENETQKLSFEMRNCHKCKKFFYKKPCGCLKRFTQNYVGDDIDLKRMVCNDIKILSIRG